MKPQHTTTRDQMKPQHTTTSFAPRIANWVAILLSMAAVPATATTIADIAGDYTGPSALPASWSYLYSSQASGGTEVALTPDLALGNGGNSGFGRVAPGIFNLPGVIGTQTGAQYEMFTDGDLNAPALGSDLLIHPGPMRRTIPSFSATPSVRTKSLHTATLQALPAASGS